MDVGLIEREQHPLVPLYHDPGFILRRASQFGTAIFEEETARHGITLPQYCVLAVLRACRGIDQISLSRFAGLDRSTTTVVLRRLEQLDLVIRRVHAKDARRKVLALTRTGRALLQRVETPATRARARLCATLDPEESDELVRLLLKIVSNHCKHSATLPAESRRPYRR
jgi:DNA-binding MarR family transcriptional regulator